MPLTGDDPAEPKVDPPGTPLTEADPPNGEAPGEPLTGEDPAGPNGEALGAPLTEADPVDPLNGEVPGVLLAGDAPPNGDEPDSGSPAAGVLDDRLPPEARAAPGTRCG
ncbi:hypothetical protein SAMN04489716_6642 [Actinoplanes derwentensis]|uniref:Uncharacterized protein n=1 Tax=Actinoplanes derwentensis TaxID=113562 RepID=A0A1H2CSL4_9ACTN|nr:hypothetical protein Ade03nite_44280 [Actinoplanes derwentensis]SDT73354.1 hypothetical protein SAMN04489716_6642 [Actinoplanes derwentensis]